MQPSPAMQALIEQIYYTFRRYPVPKQCVVCCEYCLSQQEQIVALSRMMTIKLLPPKSIPGLTTSNPS